MGKDDKCAGVAFLGKSLEADIAALKWAYKHLRLTKKYMLRIIHVNELNNANPAQERPGSRYEYGGLEAKLNDNADLDTIQADLQELKIKKFICGVTYEGNNFKEALQHALDNLEGLDTLVLGWSVADDTEGPPPIIKDLESKGCSIVLAKADSKKLTFSMPPTQTTLAPIESTEESAAPATATAPPNPSATLTAPPPVPNPTTPSAPPMKEG